MLRMLTLLFVSYYYYSANAASIELGRLLETAVGTPSSETGKLVDSWSESDEVNPEELGIYAEGDILFPTVSKNGLAAESTRWPNGVIPYKLHPGFSASERAVIESAMEDYHRMTCITFRAKQPADKDYLYITGESTGCWSSVGRIGGRQQLNLQTPGCLRKKGTVIHELMHAVGFLHEQNRHERDSHVTIMWNNIQGSHKHNFDKATKDSTNDFGVNYDYRSVMHYSEKAFSANGKQTIKPKVNGAEIGQRTGFSRGDVQKINRMYGCPKKG